jgi:hypothetical protein
MTSFSRMFILLLLIGFTLVIAGCVGQQNLENKTANVRTVTNQTVVTTAIPVTTASLQSCPTDENETYTVVQGYPFFYNGTVPNRDIKMIRVWVFGKYSAGLTKLSVSPDGSFNLTLTNVQSKQLQGKYRIIIQYPDSGSSFNKVITVDEAREEVYGAKGGVIIDIQRIRDKKMTGFEAADILEKEIQKSGKEGTSKNFTLTVEVPVIRVNPVSDHYVGDVFEVNGTTNLEPGETLSLVTEKNERHAIKGAFYFSIDGTMIVHAGPCGVNSFSSPVNLSGVPVPLLPNENWLILVNTIDQGIEGTGTTSFNISEGPLTSAVTYSENLPSNRSVT